MMIRLINPFIRVQNVFALRTCHRIAASQFQRYSQRTCLPQFNKQGIRGLASSKWSNTQSNNGQLYSQLRQILTDPRLNEAESSNMILDIFKENEISTLFDPRYQEVLSNIKQDNSLQGKPYDHIFKLNGILEMASEIKQNPGQLSDFKYEMAKLDKRTQKQKQNALREKLVGKLNKSQIIAIYFISMSSLVVIVSLIGVSNLSNFQLFTLAMLVIFITNIFNPF